MSGEPVFATTPIADPAYQATISEARASLHEFRDLCRLADASRAERMIKKEVRQGGHRAFLWFADARIAGNGFEAEVFEAPPEFTDLQVGTRFLIAENEVLDWMVNDAGDLYGGFSLRYQRAHLPAGKHEWFDQHIGVVRYC